MPKAKLDTPEAIEKKRLALLKKEASIRRRKLSLERKEAKLKSKDNTPEAPKQAPKPIPKKKQDENREIAYKMQKSPIFTIKALWNISPQPVLPKYKDLVEELIINDKQEEILPEYFDKFVRGRHFTWQQYIILRSVEDAIAGKKHRKISIRSGHGIGKSTTMSWLMIWFLICYPDCRIPCTAPTGDQLSDVLWMEIKSWISKFPDVPWLKDKFDVTQNYIRINEEGNTAYARARTARKENPEALAGLHAENMMMIVDEASGVPDEIYKVAKGAFTEKNVLVILISNPTRLEGYFHRTHTDYQDKWQTLNFSTLQSPLNTSDEYAKEIAHEHGLNSDEYRIRVLGEFPQADSVDAKGWARLLEVNEIKRAQGIADDDTQITNEDQPFVGPQRMGTDPAGEGDDTTRCVVRDKFQAKIVFKEKISNTKTIAQKILTTLIKFPLIDPLESWLDNFGVGAEVTKEIALAGVNTMGINVGVPANNKDLYANMKAEAYMRLRRWIQSGGKLSSDEEWEELSHVRFRRGLNGKVQIMSKRDMKTAGYKSPNTADALMLTFITPDDDDILAVKKHKTKQFRPNYKKVSYARQF